MSDPPSMLIRAPSLHCFHIFHDYVVRMLVLSFLIHLDLFFKIAKPTVDIDDSIVREYI